MWNNQPITSIFKSRKLGASTYNSSLNDISARFVANLIIDKFGVITKNRWGSEHSNHSKREKLTEQCIFSCNVGDTLIIKEDRILLQDTMLNKDDLLIIVSKDESSLMCDVLSVDQAVICKLPTSVSNYSQYERWIEKKEV